MVRKGLFLSIVFCRIAAVAVSTFICRLLESDHDINFDRAPQSSTWHGLGLNASLSDDEYKAGMCVLEGRMVTRCTCAQVLKL